MLAFASGALNSLGAGATNARRVVTASAAAASRLRGVACLNRVPAARGARLLCAAGGIVGTTDVKSAFELLQKGTTYLDVRTPEEFSAGHAPGAVNCAFMLAGAGGMSPNPAFLASAQAALPDKGKQTLVACKAGPRSAKASAALAELGYTGLLDVQGGFMAWEAAGLPVVK